MAVAWTVGVWANDSWLGMNGGPPNAWRGATTPVPPAPSTDLPSGVRGKGKKRELIVRMRDVENRESTADFLKAQLRLRQGITEPVAPPAPKESRAQKLARQKLEREALRNMEIERQNEERRILTDQNNAIITLLLIGST